MESVTVIPWYEWNEWKIKGIHLGCDHFHQTECDTALDPRTCSEVLTSCVHLYIGPWILHPAHANTDCTSHHNASTHTSCQPTHTRTHEEVPTLGLKRPPIDTQHSTTGWQSQRAAKTAGKKATHISCSLIPLHAASTPRRHGDKSPIRTHAARAKSEDRKHSSCVRIGRNAGAFALRKAVYVCAYVSV